MSNRKHEKLEPLPRSTFIVVALMAVVFLGAVFAGGKYYLGNWRGDMLFLPVALFLGLLLIAAVVVHFFKKS
jgi:hypothetical protein